MLKMFNFNLMVFLRSKMFWAAALLTNILLALILIVFDRPPTAWGMAAEYRVTFLPLAFLITVLVLVFLVSEESASRVDSLLDSYPYPGPAWLISKGLALATLALGLFTQLLVAGLLAQYSVGWQTNLSIYLITWLVYIVPAALWCAVLGLALGLLGKRLLSAGAVIAYWLGMLVLVSNKHIINSPKLDWALLIDLVGDTAHLNLNHQTAWDYFWPQLIYHRLVYLALTAAVMALTIGLHKLWREARFRKAALFLALVMIIAVVGAGNGLAQASGKIRAQADRHIQAIYDGHIALTPGAEDRIFFWDLPDSGWREQSYNLDVALDSARDTLAARGEVTFLNTGGDILTFTLAHTLSIEELSWKGTGLEWQRKGNVVLAQLPETISPGESLTFFIRYSGSAHIPVAIERDNFIHRSHLNRASLNLPYIMSWYPVAWMPSETLIDDSAKGKYLYATYYDKILGHHPASFSIRLAFNGDYKVWSNGCLQGAVITAQENQGLSLVGGRFIETRQGNVRLLSPGYSPVNQGLLDFLDAELDRYQEIVPINLDQVTVLISDLGIVTTGWLTVKERIWLQGQRHFHSWLQPALTYQLLEQWWGMRGLSQYNLAASWMMSDLYYLEQGLADPAKLIDLESDHFFKRRNDQGLYTPWSYIDNADELWVELIQVYQKAGASRVTEILNKLHRRFLEQGQLTQQDWDELVRGGNEDVN